MIANNCNGLCVAKKIIIHATNPNSLSKILKKILENGINLIQNSFGNYVIQAALDVNLLFLFSIGMMNTCNLFINYS
jgi:hypothetical protein